MSNKNQTLIWKTAKVKHSVRILIKTRTSFFGVKKFRHTKKKKASVLNNKLKKWNIEKNS